MADVKWIKIDTGMFDDEKIKIIQSMPEGNSILVIWVRLIILAGKTNNNGYIYINENLPYTEEMLSTIFNQPLVNIRLALQTFSSLGMLEIDNKGIYLVNFEKHQNIEGLDKIREQTKKRVAKHREKQKMLKEENVTLHVTQCNAIELEEEKNKNRKEVVEISTAAAEQKNNPLSDCRLAEIVDFYNNNINQITPMTYELLASYLNDMDYLLIIEAIKKAVLANVRNPRYIISILNSWKGKGFKVLADLDNENKKNKVEKVEITQREYTEEDLSKFYIN